MNTERLHVIALSIHDDLINTNSVNLLEKLINSLQNQINQPQQSQFQIEVSQHLTTLYKGLSEAESNEFNPTWQDIVKEIGGGDLLGRNLEKRIQDIFQNNQITPAVALKELQVLFKELNSFKEAINRVIEGFEVLNIGAEELSPGDCEIGILVPRKSVDNNMVDFGKELIELNKILNPFSELLTHA